MLFFGAILNNDKDDDNLILVSKAFQNETLVHLVQCAKSHRTDLHFQQMKTLKH